MIVINRADPSSAETISRVAINSFTAAVAPFYRPQGIGAFRNYAGSTSITERMTLGNIFYVALEGMQVVGIAELMPAANHLAMLFVLTEKQRQGIGRMLIASIMRDLDSFNGATPIITVDAAPNAVEAYEHFKFTYTGSLREKEGILYFPMALSPE